REQQHDAGKQIPFVLARRDELVDHDLRAVREIAELRFPKRERLGKIAAEAVLETQHRGLRKRRIVDFAPRAFWRQMCERYILFLVLDIDQRGVPLVERAAARILPG